ncbi:hypothetical protein B7494_g5260 [Chlorociboria aeruginascens]|nr:hypothetical protein B7494_g5260 [Chlorociboria aeruginascens]
MAAEINSQGPLEKDFEHSGNGLNGNRGHLDDNLDYDSALKRIRTAGSISISPELFEKIYLSPQNAVKGDLRKTFGNPTPVALLGFLLSLTPLACDLMGWRGAGGNGAASTGSYYFFGGLLMILGGSLEFVLGNTFPFVVFVSFGAFWLAFAATLQPFYNAYGAYSTTGTAADGLQTVGFNASFGFFMIFMGLLCLIYFICSLRTNVAFVIIFLALTLAFSLLAATYWKNAEAIAATAQGNANTSASLLATVGRVQKAAGAFAFVAALAGWWIFFAIMLAALDFPFQVPVGDLSTMIKGASERAKAKEHMV